MRGVAGWLEHPDQRTAPLRFDPQEMDRGLSEGWVGDARSRTKIFLPKQAPILRNIRSTYCDDRISFIESQRHTGHHSPGPTNQHCRFAEHRRVLVVCTEHGATKSCKMNRANTTGPPRSLACCRRHRCLYLYTRRVFS